MRKNTGNVREKPDRRKKKGKVLQCQVRFLCHAIFNFSNNSYWWYAKHVSHINSVIYEALCPSGKPSESGSGRSEVRFPYGDP